MFVAVIILRSFRYGLSLLFISYLSFHGWRAVFGVSFLFPSARVVVYLFRRTSQSVQKVSSSSLDIEEFKDSFEFWIQQSIFFFVQSTNDKALPQVERPEYIFNILLPFISNSTLEAVLTIGFTAAEMKNADIIIQKMKDVVQNCHVKRHKF